MLQSLRNNFLTGLFVLLPLAVTIAVVQFLLQKIGAGPSDLLYEYLLKPQELLGADSNLSFEDYQNKNNIIAFFLNLAATLTVLLVITFTGILSRYFIGKFFVNVADRILGAMPLVNTVYNTAKQIVQTFSTQKRAVFQKVVLVQFPRAGSYAIGFLTGQSAGEIPNRADAGSLANIFIPTTPNPTSGFLLMIPVKDIIEMDMTVGDGMKLIISGGAVIPGWEDKRTKQPEQQTPQQAS
ncbi:MAG: DUF502 domain-containing protein [Opitutae bacterium]|nr:DUF502 domain-containing protein [Opitutae bacterium]